MVKCAALVEQVLPATAEKIWEQWLDTSKLAAWFWPLYPDTVYELEPRLGGRFHFYSKKTGVGASGEITEFSPGKRLSLLWHWDDELSEDIETVQIDFTDGLISLKHDAQTIDNCTMYQNIWVDILYRLKGVLTISPAL